MGDPVDAADQMTDVGRDAAVGLERQHLTLTVGAHHLDPVDRAVPEPGHQSRALADRGRRDPPADQRVHQGGLAGLESPRDRDLQWRGQPVEHDAQTGGGARGHLGQ